MSLTRIASLALALIETPIKMKRSQGIGSVQSKIKRVILEITTDDGIVGLGEAAPWDVFSGTAEATVVAIDTYLRPHLIGADSTDITAIMQRCGRGLFGHPEAKAAVEMALYDISAKALGVPVHRLLGGMVRDRIPMSFSIANPDIGADIAMAQRLHGEGIRIFKVKTGFSTHAEDLSRLERLRRDLPTDIDLRVDYNQGLEPWNAIPTLRDIEAFKPTFIEQPVARGHIDAMAKIAAALDTPIMADESVFDAAEALVAIQARAADLISIKLMKCGGIGPARKVAAVAEAAGIACYGGTLWEGGIALAAGTHMIAATQTVSLGCEFYMPRFVMEPDITIALTPIEDGKVVVPQTPGLGITLDRSLLEAQTIGRW